jgi:hypothetical protein
MLFDCLEAHPVGDVRGGDFARVRVPRIKAPALAPQEGVPLVGGQVTVRRPVSIDDENSA